MNELDSSFAKLLGRQPNDAERQKLYAVQDALGLKNNDALWLILLALQHYETLYEKVPSQISAAVTETALAARATADVTMRASAESIRADLAAAVASAAKEVAYNTSRKQTLQWAAGCLVLAFLFFGSFGWYMHNAGYQSGIGVGYTQARDEKAAAAWANTSEGKAAFRLSQTTSLKMLLNCDVPGWKIIEQGSNRVCQPGVLSSGINGWKLP